MTDPQFSQYAAAVLQSPYFLRLPDLGDVSKNIALAKQRDREQERLFKAVTQSKDYKSLPDEAKALWAKARKSMDEDYNNEITMGRLADDLGFGDDEEEEDVEPLTAEECQILTAAIVEATAAGDRKTAQILADLADDPTTFREVIGNVPTKEENTSKKVSSSPLRERKMIRPQMKGLMSEQEKEDLKQRHKAVKRAVDEMWDAWMRLPDLAELFDNRIKDFHRFINNAHNVLRGSYNTIADRRSTADRVGEQSRQLASILSMTKVPPEDEADHRRCVETFRAIALATVKINRSLDHLAQHPHAK